jgi:hypothetical protein
VFGFGNPWPVRFSQYECELQTTPIELGEPTRAFTGAKTQLVSANFKMSNSYFGFYFGVGENLTGHGLPNPTGFCYLNYFY